jgi:phage-related minor tail protein
VYDDAAQKYEENNAGVLAQNEAQAKLDATMASLGETVAPINTALTELASDVLSALQPYIQSFAENYLPSIKEALGEVGSHLESALTWLKEHQTILSVMAGIIGGIVVAIGLYNAVAAIKAAMDAAQVTTLGALIAAQLASAAATITALAPYLLIVAAIAAVIAIIVLCVKNWDKIKEATKKAFEKMKEAVLEGVEKIKGFFQKIIDFIKNNWQGLLLLILNPFAGAFKLAYDNCEGFRNKVDGFVAKVKELISAGFNKVKENIINPIKNAKDNAVQTFENLKSGIMNKINSAKDKVKEVIDKIKGFFKFDWKLPKLKMPHLKISGEFSLAPPKVPKFSIDWYARGGVFDKPTLFPYGNGAIGGLGEAGAEAIVPLENNTEWLDKIAAKLQGNTTPVILQVGEKVFGEIAVASINNITKQQGAIPLVFA